MKKNTLGILLFALLAMVCKAQTSIQFCKNGHSKYQLYCQSSVSQKAAEILRDHIDTITGIKLDIIRKGKIQKKSIAFLAPPTA